MTPPERKKLLQVLCRFADAMERRAALAQDVPTFVDYIARQLDRLLERAIEERPQRIL